jgi:hypothetical protein
MSRVEEDQTDRIASPRLPFYAPHRRTHGLGGDQRPAPHRAAGHPRMRLLVRAPARRCSRRPSARLTRFSLGGATARRRGSSESSGHAVISRRVTR